MTPADFRLYDVLDLAAQAVDEAASGRPGDARVRLNAARAAAAAYAPTASPQAVHAIGLLLDAASPARYRLVSFSASLWHALSVHGTAALNAIGCGDLLAETLEFAAESAGPLHRLSAAFTVVRDEIRSLAQTEAAA
jgi:hypothetical protein